MICTNTGDQDMFDVVGRMLSEEGIGTSFFDAG